MNRSNITTLSLPWNQIGSTLPNLSQFIRLSLQKLRLEYKDKEAIPTIWHELGRRIGRRGCLQVDGLFEMGCGANPSTRIDSAKHPTEAAKLKELYAAPTAMTQQAAENGWIEEQIVPNLTLSVTGVPSPVEPSQEEVKAMITRVPDTKHRCQISPTAFKTEMPACFRFSHRRRQEKAIERKLDFVRDQALAELRDFRRTLGKGDEVSVSIQTQVDSQTTVTASFFSQDQHKLQIPNTEEGQTFQASLNEARKAPNKFLQACLAEGKANTALTPFATLKEAAKVLKSDSTVKERKVAAA